MRQSSKLAAKKDRFLTIRLERDLHEELARVARKNERTIAAEIRLMARNHLDRLRAGKAA